jgi:transcriptional regulator with XRE-family HTH domain
VDHWADVAKVVNERMAERSMTQQELATLSGVSVATLRKIQAGVSQQRTRGVLANISRALGLAEDHLWRVSRGEAPTGEPQSELSTLRTEMADLARRVEALESRLATTAER